MQLHDALTQISEIRQQIARTETFRGYRSLTVGSTSLLAFIAAGLQPVVAPAPKVQIEAYLLLWVSTAGLALGLCGWEMLHRARRAASPLAAQHTWLAIEQFAPCVLAGGALTVALYRFAPESLWLLPGLWSVLFSLGVFASRRLLPRATFGVAAFYLLSGLVCLAVARGPAAFSPWAMAVPFGIGQAATAGILYWNLERPHARS